MLSHAMIDGFSSADCTVTHEIRNREDGLCGPTLVISSEHDCNRGRECELVKELEARKLTAAQAEAFANAFAEYTNVLRDLKLAGARKRGEPMAEDTHGVQELITAATGGE